ncbi:hypothetical protein CLV30_101137 [Haloactinopolyspora alba]|uniref:Uncharacterized protein n=1 Tax=Haloactinopolyspora alba TaxID=648780 RepID=A0A2P8EFD8_9ACTN|nr:hypothetical protein CLV30_101137 [Haloactinopolyspora alba]
MAPKSAPSAGSTRELLLKLSLDSSDVVKDQELRVERTAQSANHQLIEWTADAEQIALDWGVPDEVSSATTWQIVRDGRAIETVSSTQFVDRRADPRRGHLYKIRALHTNGSVGTFKPYFFMIDVPERRDYRGRTFSEVKAMELSDGKEINQEERVEGHNVWWNTFIPPHHVESSLSQVLCPELILPSDHLFRGDGTAAQTINEFFAIGADGIPREFTESGNFGWDIPGEESSRTSTRWRSRFYTPQGATDPTTSTASWHGKVGTTAIDEKITEEAPEPLDEWYYFETVEEAESDLNWEPIYQNYEPDMAYTYLEHDASDPLCAGGAAPAISYGAAFFSHPGGRVSIVGEHDQAPSHEIGVDYYVNGNHRANKCLYRFNNRGFEFLAPPAPNATVDIDLNILLWSRLCNPQ